MSASLPLRIRAAPILAVLLTLLGFAVTCGWLFRIPALTRILPGYTSMMLSTAIGFALFGLSLLARRSDRRALQHAGLAMAVLVLLLALANGLQIITGMNLGIDWPQLHGWIGDRNRTPGRMSEPTTICFVLASLSRLLLGAPRRASVEIAGKLFAALVLTVALIALLGYALHVEALYRWYLFSRMAIHTAIGIAVLGMALWLEWRERDGPRLDRHGRGIVTLAAASLVVVAVTAGLVSATWFRSASDAALTRTQEALRQARAVQLAVTLRQRSERSAIVTTRTQLLEQMSRPIGSPEDREARQRVVADLASLRPHGFSSIVLRDAADGLLIADGTPLPAGLPEFPLKIDSPGVASLIWNAGFILRNRHSLTDHGRVLGTVVTEQPLPDLLTLFDRVGGAGSQVLVCGEPKIGPALACLPPDESGAATAPPENFRELLRSAGAGLAGHADLFDEQGHGLQFTYGPVDGTGLVLALAVPDSELYAPVRSALAYGVLLVMLVSVISVLVMRARVRPLAEKLAASEGRYALVVNAMHEGLLLIDDSGQVRATNDFAARIFNYRPEDLIGRSMHGQWPVYREDETPLPVEEYPGVIALQTGRAIVDCPIRIRRADGEMRRLRLSATPMVDAGRERYMVITFADVTEERLAAERERATESRFRQIIDHIEDYAIFLLDLQGRIATWNPGAEKIKGCGADQAIGQHFSIFYVEDDRRSGLPEQLLRTAAAEGRSTSEGWRLRRNGERFWASIVISPVFDERGVLTGYAKITRDLTERRRAEQALRASEESYRGLVNGVADGVVSVDGQGIVQSLNPAAEAMFGWSAAEVIGRNVAMLIPERFRPSHDGHVARFAGGHEPRLLGLRREVTGLRRNGVEFPVMLALSGKAGGGSDRHVALVSDLTERKRHEGALAEVHRRMRSLVDSAPFAIIASDTRGIVDIFNPAAERLTFYSREDMIGKLVQPIHVTEEIELRAAELSETLGEEIKPGIEVFTALPRRGITDIHEWTYVRKDGSKVPVQLAISELRDPEDGSVTGYIGVAYDISERKRREEYTQHIAYHDFLTGLPNRQLLDDRLGNAIQRARRHSQTLALLMLDLDHFKRVNDSLGHHVGDELLKTTALRLRSCVRGSDTVARLGGDEFIVLVEELDEPRAAERVAEKIVEALAEPIYVGEHCLHVSASVGLAFYPDDAGSGSVMQLMRSADAAMYRAKEAGRGRYVMFNPEIGRLAHERLAMEQALRRALHDGEFRIHYQPQIDLRDGRVIGCEALLRWHDPDNGMVMPDVFVPIAEDCGLIVQIGSWVLHTACREAAEMQRRIGQPLRLAVNLSPRQFHHESLIASVGAALADSGLQPGQLELEITEGLLMSDAGDPIERLRALRELGVTIAIDDFGVGFSSLAYLARLPVDTLKIDRSFIRNLLVTANDALVVEAILALAGSLGVGVTAEGVESPEQLAFLVEHGTTLAARGVLQAQGFCFGEAVALEDFIGGHADCAVRSRALLPAGR